MKKLILIIFIVFNIQKINASCDGGSVSIAPRSNELSQNPVILIDFMERDYKIYDKLEEMRFYLVDDKGKETELEILEKNKGDHVVAQVLLKPKKKLKKGRKMFLKVSNMPTDGKYWQLFVQKIQEKNWEVKFNTDKVAPKFDGDITFKFSASSTGYGVAGTGKFWDNNEHQHKIGGKFEQEIIIEAINEEGKRYLLTTRGNLFGIYTGNCGSNFRLTYRAECQFKLSLIDFSGNKSEETKHVKFRTVDRIIELYYPQKELIPEGIAVYLPDNKLFLSSIHKKKITETNIRSGWTDDLIRSGEHGYKSGLGLEIKDHKLFALSGEEKDGKTISDLLVIDLKNIKNVNSYKLSDTASHFMNDLAISDENEIYITDTKRHCVYKLNYPEGEIELFIEDEQIKHPNGITISEDNQKLYVDSWADGVRIIDISTKKILNKKNDLTSEIGIDGMKYYKGNLYAIRNGGNDRTKHGLIKIKLSDKGDEIIGVEPLLMNDPMMNIPTTIDIVDGTIYILANSQMDNLDQATNEIKDKDKLTNTYVIKYRIRGDD